MPSRISTSACLLLSLALAGCGNPEAAWDACQRAVETGARLEREGRYAEAEQRYREACAMDPVDPVPPRYLGELHRHHSGDWEQAEALFRRVLALTEDGADPLSRAVALHGLGKMTVWHNRFEEGLRLMEASLATCPTALCCRNLAIYWMGENRADKWKPYAEQALALEPEDPYNRVFQAVCLDFEGRCAEARALAAATPDALDQSYNRACIQAMCGFPEEALALLQRHFYAFETNDRVRAREMKEARSDITLRKLFGRKEFWELTRLAETAGIPEVVPPGGMHVPP